MRSIEPIRHLSTVTVALLVASATAAAQVVSRLPGTMPPPRGALVATAATAAGTMTACVADAMAQRLPIRVAIELCRIKQLEDAQVRRPAADIGAFGSSGGQDISPGSITSTCNAGVDPRLGKDPAYSSVGDETLAALEKSTRDAAAQAKDPTIKAGLLAEAKKMVDEMERREERNITVPDTRKRTAEGGLCAQVLHAAREFVRECNRTGWRTTACQQLNARMNGCPNPTQILVDPDQGYSCGQAADPKAVAEAWSRKCAQVTSPGPDGRTPCAPFSPLGGDGRIYAGGAQNLCADTRAFIDGGSDMCYTTLEARNPLAQSIEQLIAVISKQVGGPIIVLPPPRPRGAAPEPRPRPRPGTGA